MCFLLHFSLLHPGISFLASTAWCVCWGLGFGGRFRKNGWLLHSPNCVPWNIFCVACLLGEVIFAGMCVEPGESVRGGGGGGGGGCDEG